MLEKVKGELDDTFLFRRFLYSALSLLIGSYDRSTKSNDMKLFSDPFINELEEAGAFALIAYYALIFDEHTNLHTVRPTLKSTVVFAIKESVAGDITANFGAWLTTNKQNYAQHNFKF